MASSSKTIDTVPDHLTCPICMDIPKDKVFQCINGHIICEACSSQLTTCPQCRVPFGAQRIRSLAIENMLDELRLECSYKDSGCQSNFDRKSIQDHLKNCDFYNMAMFGPLVDVCQVLFFKKCEFRMNRGNAQEAIQHFQQYHGALLAKREHCRTNLNREYLKTLEVNLNKHPSFPAEILEPRLKGVEFWPTILQVGEAGHYFLILWILSKDSRILSLASFFFRDVNSGKGEGVIPASSPLPQYKVKCSVEYNEIDCITWSITPVDILTVRELPLYYAMPMATFLRKSSKDGKGININMKVKKIKKTLCHI